MNRLFTAAFCFLAASVFGASPDFRNFNQTQFGTQGLSINIRSGSLQTNSRLTDPIIQRGTNILDATNQQQQVLGAVKEGTASSVNVYADRLGGSVSPASGHSIQGHPIHQNLQQPLVVISSRGVAGTSNNPALATERNMWASIESFKTNGLLAWSLANGLRVIYESENPFTNHRSSVNGYYVFDSNRFPSTVGSHLNPSLATNLVRIATTNGLGYGIMTYIGTTAPTNGNTEIDLVTITGLGTWHYPNGVNNLGAGDVQPIVDGTSYGRDTEWAYGIGLEMLTFQDTIDAYLSGWQKQVWREIADAAINPTFNGIPGDRPFQSWYGDRPGMIINHLISTPTFWWSPLAEGLMNAMTFGSGGESIEPAGSGSLGFTMMAIRPQLHAITNWSPRTCYFFMQTDNLAGTAALNPSNWSYQEWKNHLSVAAFFQTYYPWATYPHPFDNPNFKVNFTNANLLPMLKDRSHRVFPINVGATNSMFGRWNEDKSQVWFLAMNESPTATTNLTVTWAQLGIPTNQVARISNTVSNQQLATVSTNGWTLIVLPTNVVVLTFDVTDWIPDSGGNAVVFGVPGFTNAIQLSLIAAGQIAIGNSPYTLSALHIDHPSTTYDLGIGSAGASYLFRRNAADGIFEMFGEQSGANGFRLTGADGIYGLFRPPSVGGSYLTSVLTNNAGYFGDGRGLTNGSPALATNNATAIDGMALVKRGGNLNLETVSGSGDNDPTNNAPFTITTNDFAFGVFQTNANQRAYVSQCFGLFPGVSTAAKVALYIDQEQNGSFEQTGICIYLNNSSGATSTYSATNQLGAFIQPNARFVFTNLSAVGTDATIMPGSAQWVKQ